jgi:hypothetical protein
MNSTNRRQPSPERMGRTIKQLRAGELLFTDENILEVITIYLFLNRDKMIRESAEDRRWDLRFAAQDIFTGNDDMLEWLERESVECEEWLVSAMQDQERFKGTIMEKEQCRQIFRCLLEDALSKLEANDSGLPLHKPK